MSHYIKLFFTAPLWASSFIIGQVLVVHLSPILISFFRFLIASIAMASFLWFRHRKSPNKLCLLLPKSKEDWWQVLLLAFFGVFLYNLLFTIGLQYVPGTRAAAIIPTNPVFLVLISWIVYQEPLGIIRAVGIFLAFIGALLVVTKGDVFILFTAFSIYDFWLLGAILCWIVFVMLTKNFLKRYGALEMTTWAFAVGTLMLAMGIPLLGDINTIAAAFSRFDTWWQLFIMGFGASALAFIWYFDGMHKVGVIRSAVFVSLVPVMAMFEAYLFLGQTIYIYDWCGAFMVASGVYLVNRPNNHKPQPIIN